MVFDVLHNSSGGRILGRQVGTIALGKACNSTFKVYSSHYAVSKSDASITITPRSTNVVARCATS
jgi:hypothetical protein